MKRTTGQPPANKTSTVGAIFNELGKRALGKHKILLLKNCTGLDQSLLNRIQITLR